MVSPEIRGPKEHTYHCAPRRPHHHHQGHWPKKRAQHGYQAPPVGGPHDFAWGDLGDRALGKKPLVLPPAWEVCRAEHEVSQASPPMPSHRILGRLAGGTSVDNSRTPRAQEPRGLGPIHQDQLLQEKGAWARGLKGTPKEERAPRFWGALQGFQLRSRLKSHSHCPGPLALPELSFAGRFPGCPPQGGQAGQEGSTAPACLPGRLPDGGTWSRAVPSASPHLGLPEWATGLALLFPHLMTWCRLPAALPASSTWTPFAGSPRSSSSTRRPWSPDSPSSMCATGQSW